MLAQRFSVAATLAGAVLFVSLLMTGSAQLGAQASEPVTFHKDVEPILQKNCQSCHRPGQIAPMSLLTFADARPWARSIKAKVVARQMPPWFADPAHGEFRNDRRMKQSDIDTLVRWVDAGAPAGDVKDAPPPVQWPADGWAIKPDLVLTGLPFTVPARGYVEWTHVTVPSPFKEDTWVTSIEVKPSKLAVTHHICIASKPHTPDVKYGVFEYDQIPRDAEGLEAPRFKNQPRPPVVNQRTGSTQESCYVPGFSTADYRPYNAAKLFGPNMDIVFTVHYTPNGEEVVDIPQVGFTIAKTPPARRTIQYALSAVRDADSFAIPPFEGNWQSPPVDVTFNADVELIWMMPHMHVRGKDMTYRLDYPDGRSETVLNVPNYDFNWQLGYEPVTPIKVPKGTKMHVDAHFDNSPRNKANPDPSKTVYYGDMTWEEMMAPFIGITFDINVDPKTLLKRGNGTQEGNGG